MSEIIRDLTFEMVTPYVYQLDRAIRTAVPAGTIAGVSVGDNLRVHLLIADTSQDATISGVVAGHNTLSPISTQAQIDADGVDEAVISVDGLTVFDYQIWLWGEVIASGTVNDGSLEFSTDTVGVYLVEIFDGDDTGHIEVEAV